MSRMVWPKIRQTEKARIFDGTALSLVYPGAIPTPLLPLIGWIFEKVVDSINGSRGETELCSFVYFIYVTICLVYVKKKESKNQFFLFWGTSSCRSRSGFVRCNESVATDTSLIVNHSKQMSLASSVLSTFMQNTTSSPYPQDSTHTHPPVR